MRARLRQLRERARRRRRRFLARMKGASPVLLDVAGFAAITIGVALIYGPAGWIAAGLFSILLGLRAQQ